MPDRWFQSPEYVERLSARLHDIYQAEAHRRGDDDTELRAIFGEPVEGRDFTRIDGEEH